MSIPEETAERGLPASEIGFNTMLRWPSEGGRFEEAAQLINHSPYSQTGAVSTLGLVTGGDPDADPNLREFGELTAMLHLIGPKLLDESDWNKVAEIERHGRIPGIYGIDYPAAYLVILPPYRPETLWRRTT